MAQALRKDESLPGTEKKSSTHFYRDLPSFSEFNQVTDTSKHQDLPDDWDIVIADVIGSTNAIRAGRYKDVNMIGAACIAAITNINRDLRLPFVFGGDGATFATPSFMREQVREALAGTRKMAQDAFGLGLRTGIVPVHEVRKTGNWARVGKFKMSEFVCQPAFSGRGWEAAERLIKDPVAGAQYLVPDNYPGTEADFSGLECRWNGIPSTRDCKVALLIVSTDPDPERHVLHYNAVMKHIDRIFGSLDEARPLDESLLDLSLRWSVLVKEASVQTTGKSFVGRALYVARTFLLCLIGLYLFARKVDTKETQWSRYKADFVQNSDYKKFDGMLRMVIDATFEQKDALVSALEEMRKAGLIKYGVHGSPQAIVTCLIADYNGHHTHFLDGSDGGYAMAAVQLKAQFKDDH